MVPSDVPDEVKRLLREHISSVEQLEILLMLRTHRDQEFDTHAVHQQLRTSEVSAAARLFDLAERGFLTMRQAGETTFFKFAPSVQWLASATDLLALAYNERRYRVIELIFSKPIENLRVFAGAFRFRKDKSDG